VHTAHAVQTTAKKGIKMKVITYVNKELTVINGNNYYKGKASKPSFISSTNFYYEPTLQIADGKQLTPVEIKQAEAFISSFVFPQSVKATVKPNVHCVDLDGNYIGLMVNDGTYNEVATAPSVSTYKWDGTAWVDSVLVDTSNGKYIGIGDNRTISNSKYAPNTIPKDFNPMLYYWNGTSWNISLADAKKDRIDKIGKQQRASTLAITGNLGMLEDSSYSVQETEARAWLLDNKVSTPFIDGLLVARATVGETKALLVNKIVTHSDAYKIAYSTLLGKFQRICLQVNSATTVSEVAKIVW